MATVANRETRTCSQTLGRSQALSDFSDPVVERASRLPKLHGIALDGKIIFSREMERCPSKWTSYDPDPRAAIVLAENVPEKLHCHGDARASDNTSCREPFALH
jgi:hypothetical protein